MIVATVKELKQFLAENDVPDDFKLVIGFDGSFTVNEPIEASVNDYESELTLNADDM